MGSGVITTDVINGGGVILLDVITGGGIVATDAVIEGTMMLMMMSLVQLMVVLVQHE